MRIGKTWRALHPANCTASLSRRSRGSGGPPSAVRILGCLWLLKVLYPAYASGINMRDETIEFYRMFYRYDKFDEYTLDNLLSAAGIDPVTGEKA